MLGDYYALLNISKACTVYSKLRNFKGMALSKLDPLGKLYINNHSYLQHFWIIEWIDWIKYFSVIPFNWRKNNQQIVSHQENLDNLSKEYWQKHNSKLIR